MDQMLNPNFKRSIFTKMVKVVSVDKGALLERSMKIDFFVAIKKP